MKSLIKYLSAVAIAAGLTATVKATPINGSIGFTGAYATDTGNLGTATAFTSFSGVATGGGATGDYSGVPGGYTPVSFSGFSFGASSVTPLWTFTHSGTTYSFDATSITVTTQTSTDLTVKGSGVAWISGTIFRDPTVGLWIITANNLGGNFSFSSSAAVPDGGTTALLLGLGLLGVGIAARRFKKA